MFLSHGSPLHNNYYDFYSREFYKSSAFNLFTWISSIVAMTLGLAKFITCGPMKTNRHAVLNVLIQTAFVLRLATCVGIFRLIGRKDFIIPFVLCLGMIPFVISSVMIMKATGFSKSLLMLKLYPPTFISPIFSPIIYTYRTNQKLENGSHSSMENERCALSIPSLCHQNNDSGSGTSKCDNDWFNKDAKSGFYIWKSATIINYLYMILIPAVFPFHNPTISPNFKYSIHYENLLLFASALSTYSIPIIVCFAIICIVYFTRCGSLFLSEFKADTYDPKNPGIAL